MTSINLTATKNYPEGDTKRIKVKEEKRKGTHVIVSKEGKKSLPCLGLGTE